MMCDVKIKSYITWDISDKQIFLNLENGMFLNTLCGQSDMNKIIEKVYEKKRLHFKMENQHARRWVFTINNYPDNHEEMLLKLMNDCNGKYLVFGYEKGEKETPHLQGYIRFASRVYRSTIKKILNESGCYGYWAIANGTEMQNFDYCTKQGDWREYGERPGNLMQSLERKQKYIDLCSDWLNLPQDEFEAKWPYENLMLRNKLRQYESEKQTITRAWDGDLRKKNLWIYGPPGTGKSKWARDRGYELNLPVYPKMANKWWGGYEKRYHRLVLFEDFPKEGQFLAQLMKIWADRYSFIGEIKGSSVIIEPGNFFLIVTSNYSIEETFVGDDKNAIERRFLQVYIRDKQDAFLFTTLEPDILSKF